MPQLNLRPPGMDVLALPGFRRLLAAEVMFDVSGNMRLAAQSWVVLELTGSALWVGLVAGARGIPALAFGLLGGVAADRLPRKLILSLGWTGLGLLAAVTAVLILTDQVRAWHIAALSAATGVAIAFTLPAAFSLVASIVPQQRLSNALGSMTLSWSAAEMAAPAVAGAILSRAAADLVFWLVAGGYLLAVVLLTRVSEPKRDRGPERTALLADLRAGIAYVRRTQPLPVITLLAFQQNLMAVAIMPLVPVYAKQVLDVGAGGYGLLAGAMGAGFLSGSIAIAAFGNFRRRGLTMVLTGAVWDSCAVVFAFSRLLPLSMAMLFLMALAGAFWINAGVTAFQERAADEMRGRAMSVWGITAEMFPIGWLIGGALAEAFGNENALIISALCGTPVAILFFALSPSFRRL